jgi:hypothetical protein
MIAFGNYSGEIASNPGSVKLVDFWKGLLGMGTPDFYFLLISLHILKIVMLKKLISSLENS